MENEDTQFFFNSINALGDMSSVLLNFLPNGNSAIKCVIRFYVYVYSLVS